MNTTETPYTDAAFSAEVGDGTYEDLALHMRRKCAALERTATELAEALEYHQNVADSLWSTVENRQTMRDKRCSALTKWTEFKGKGEPS